MFHVKNSSTSTPSGGRKEFVGKRKVVNVISFVNLDIDFVICVGFGIVVQQNNNFEK